VRIISGKDPIIQHLQLSEVAELRWDGAIQIVGVEQPDSDNRSHQFQRAFE